MGIEPGLIYESERVVAEEHTAAALDGEKFPHVLSTPHLIGWIETCAHDAISSMLQNGQGSVGTVINIRHMAATPVGMIVRMRVELEEVDRRKLKFKVEAWDELEKILEGEHERFITDAARFETNLAQKTGEWRAKSA